MNGTTNQTAIARTKRYQSHRYSTLIPYRLRHRKQINGLNHHDTFLDVHVTATGEWLYSIQLAEASSCTLHRTSSYTLSQDNTFLMVTTCTAGMGERDYHSEVYQAATGQYCCLIEEDNVAFAANHTLYAIRYAGAITAVIDTFTGTELEQHHDQGALFYNNQQPGNRVQAEAVIEISVALEYQLQQQYDAIVRQAIQQIMPQILECAPSITHAVYGGAIGIDPAQLRIYWVIPNLDAEQASKQGATLRSIQGLTEAALTQAGFPSIALRSQTVQVVSEKAMQRTGGRWLETPFLICRGLERL